MRVKDYFAEELAAGDESGPYYEHERELVEASLSGEGKELDPIVPEEQEALFHDRTATREKNRGARHLGSVEKAPGEHRHRPGG